ncbi:MAG TPA: prenyltransferase [Pseudomonadales bacterium]|jgi:1,4-dihydroxy-2-naphthoate octaprenyltransferase
MASNEPSHSLRKQYPVWSHVLATRPAFLLASIVPVLIGLAAAHHDAVAFHPVLAGMTLAGAVCVHAAANVLNDYYDARNGTDAANTARLFPFTGGSRFIQNGVFSAQRMAGFGIGLLLIVAVLGLLLLWQLPPSARPGLLMLGCVGVLLSWAYSAPPLALNSHGWGEMSVAIGFGVLMPAGADYVQRAEWAWLPVMAALPYALLVANLLWINQFPDCAADASAGKRHWVVRLGVVRARVVYSTNVLLAYWGLLAMVWAGYLPVACSWAMLAMPLSLWAGWRLWRYGGDEPTLVPAIQCTIAAMMLYGVLVSMGLALS